MMQGPDPVDGEDAVCPFPEHGHWAPTKATRHLAVHRNDGLEVVYVAKGELQWMVEGRIEQVSSGSVFFTLPWQSHGGTEEAQPGCELYFAVVALDRLYERATDDFGFHPTIPIRERDTQRVASVLLNADQHAYYASSDLAWLITHLVRELDDREAGSPTIAASLASAMLIHLTRVVQQESDKRNEATSADVVRNFLADLQESCHEPWTLQGMAAACNLGRTRFSEYVKLLTGDTPIAHLNRLRIHRAKELLREGDRTITSVAFNSGFQSTHYFARVFKEFVGVTASLYRDQHGDQN